ncbi:MAG: GNAT family N-acetyltransferase [Rhizobiales bacterium]|nr:GNAT family N-acetyltransferase [Hyphomicrobiales bacterium]
MIEEYTPRAQSEVIALANRVFGAGYFRATLAIGKESGSLLLVWRGSEGRIAGFVQGRRLPKDALRGFLDYQLNDFPADIDAADASGALGVIQAVAVDAAARRRGIGAKLLRAMHDDLVGEDADKLIVTFKLGASAANVDKLMNKLGFELWASLPSF